MSNRFRFRAGITLQYYKDDGEDGEVQIIINNISIDSGGGAIMVHREQVIDELRKAGLSEDEQEHALDYLNSNFSETNEYFYIDSVDFIEQCAGLKDKNNKLIYEGDIVKEISIDEESAMGREFEEVSVVCFGGGEYPFSFTLKHPRFYRGYALLDYGYMREEIEIIGNIHETPELIGE